MAEESEERAGKESAGDGRWRQLVAGGLRVIGVVHCPAFPGSPRYDGRSPAALYEAVVADAERYARGGVDGLIVENHGDIPFLRPQDLGVETAAFLAVATERVLAATGLPTGVNILANAPFHALAVARASGADFVRVNQWTNAYVANEGLLDGDAARALRYRKQLGAEGVAIFADAHVKHGAHALTADRPLAELARDLEFFDADVAIATGHRTGDAVDPAELEDIAGAVSLPVVVGSGVTRENVASLHPHASAVIIGSSLKVGGQWQNPVAEDRVRSFMEEVIRIREGSPS